MTTRDNVDYIYRNYQVGIPASTAHQGMFREAAIHIAQQAPVIIATEGLKTTRLVAIERASHFNDNVVVLSL